MAKKIVFSIITQGMDGRGKRSYLKSSFDEKEIKEAFDKDKNKAYNALHEEIVDIDPATKQAWCKLNSLEKLLLGLDQDK